jgi:parallel beta-helix repeat protein
MKNKSAAHFVALAVLTFLAAGSSSADEGKIPLFEPTAITQPGHYVVTRDIVAATGPIFDVQADGVRLDLGGHTLTLTGAGEDVILLSAAGSEKGIVIAGGTVQGGRNGVASQTDPLGKIVLTLADLKIVDPAEGGIIINDLGMMEARGIIIVDSRTAIDLRGGTAGEDLGTARIVGAHIQADRGIVAEVVSTQVLRGKINTCGTGVRLTDAPGSKVAGADFVHPLWRCGFQPQPEPPGIVMIGSAGSSVHDNVFRGTHRMGVEPSPFIGLYDSRGVFVADNVIHGPSAADDGNHGILADATSDHVFIRGNSISGCGEDGIHVLSSGNSIRANLVNGNGRHGIFVGGSNNLVEGTRASANGADGIHFDNASGPHVYRQNMLRGNLGSAIGGVVENTDAGGNVL